ncbi:hypothetical protein BDV36DRAFT_278673 [Aspergillus pseudocaelatus]|uniref:Uncharacterized protein n=1 Tax=Aspergillus pseudocaelatus TaxID=1825620 RepID=A0ABQ6VZ30_9EURO|nr:hypothetical protein BDV36DRAFT_278673 [Aspergillus pseudocaelatus]
MCYCATVRQTAIPILASALILLIMITKDHQLSPILSISGMPPYDVSLEKNLARRRDSFINLPYNAAPQSPSPLLLYSHRNHNIMIHSFLLGHN